VKAHAARLGLDPGAFAGHSLRSGFLTSAAARGASIFKMMDVSRHKSVDTLRGCVRDADAFRDHAAAGCSEVSFGRSLHTTASASTKRAGSPAEVALLQKWHTREQMRAAPTFGRRLVTSASL
jgi:hypothetical protein